MPRTHVSKVGQEQNLIKEQLKAMVPFEYPLESEVFTLLVKMGLLGEAGFEDMERFEHLVRFNREVMMEKLEVFSFLAVELHEINKAKLCKLMLGKSLQELYKGKEGAFAPGSSEEGGKAHCSKFHYTGIADAVADRIMREHLGYTNEGGKLLTQKMKELGVKSLSYGRGCRTQLTKAEWLAQLAVEAKEGAE